MSSSSAAVEPKTETERQQRTDSVCSNASDFEIVNTSDQEALSSFQSEAMESILASVNMLKKLEKDKVPEASSEEDKSTTTTQKEQTDAELKLQGVTSGSEQPKAEAVEETPVKVLPEPEIPLISLADADLPSGLSVATVKSTLSSDFGSAVGGPLAAASPDAEADTGSSSSTFEVLDGLRHELLMQQSLISSTVSQVNSQRQAHENKITELTEKCAEQEAGNEQLQAELKEIKDLLAVKDKESQQTRDQLDEVYAKFVRSEELVKYYETQSRELTDAHHVAPASVDLQQQVDNLTAELKRKTDQHGQAQLQAANAIQSLQKQLKEADEMLKVYSNQRDEDERELADMRASYGQQIDILKEELAASKRDSKPRAGSSSSEDARVYAKCPCCLRNVHDSSLQEHVQLCLASYNQFDS